MVRPYNRRLAINYAHRWAYGRNPQFYDFSDLGGDCTNFASQCLFAGSGVMNYSKTNGWYYISLNDRSPSWTGVNELYHFLTTNKTRGPFAVDTSIEFIRPGDIIQLDFEGDGIFNHSPVVVATGATPSIDNIRVAAHSNDVDYYPLSRYPWSIIRFLHIVGVYV